MQLALRTLALTFGPIDLHLAQVQQRSLVGVADVSSQGGAYSGKQFRGAEGFVT